MDKEGKYQIKTQVLTYHTPVEIPAENAGSDYDIDSEAKVEENETSAVEAAFNPIENFE